MAIKPIKRKRISDEVLEQMKGNIISGEWAPGEKIPGEMELTQMFGVSRISVREAIHRLAGMGVLVIKRGEGTFVTEALPQESFNDLLPYLMIQRPSLTEILEFRAIIEIESARLAAVRADERDMEELSKALERMKADKGDYDAFAADDLNYHMLLALATKNNVIIKVNAILHDMLQSSMKELIRKVGFSKGIHYHTLILDAIRKRDGGKAALLMKEHIAAILEDVQPERPG